MRTSLAMTWVSFAVVAWTAVCSALAQTSDTQTTVIWVAIENRSSLKKTAPGAMLEGKLARAVYWQDWEIFPKSSEVRMAVDHTEPRKKSYSVDDRPFFIHLFAPRHEWAARFRSVKVLLPGGQEISLRATFIALSQRAELKARTAGSTKSGSLGRDAKPSSGAKAPPPWIMTLQIEPEGTSLQSLAEARAAKEPGAAAVCSEPCTVAAGTRMPAVLLGGLSASQNREGQTFQAMLLEPVLVDSRAAIPEGTIVQGVLAQRVPPRRLYRPASLNLLFTRLVLPGGAATAIAASPVAAEVDRGTHMTMDSEGRFHAQHPGKARFLLDFGVTGGISKVSDDTTQLIIEAISSTATDASTAGVARFAAMGGSAIYLLTRHGRDVILPPYTEMDLSLSRAVSVASGPTVAQSAH
jgi:hypothetical protein